MGTACPALRRPLHLPCLHRPLLLPCLPCLPHPRLLRSLTATGVYTWLVSSALDSAEGRAWTAHTATVPGGCQWVALFLAARTKLVLRVPRLSVSSSNCAMFGTVISRSFSKVGARGRLAQAERHLPFVIGPSVTRQARTWWWCTAPSNK